MKLKHVHAYTDRHGKRRWYFRCSVLSAPLPNPGPLQMPSKEFSERYRELMGVLQIRQKAAKAAKDDVVGLVYVIGFSSYVKIGFTTDLRRRIKNLQTGCPERLSVFRAVSGRLSDERALHDRFIGSRLQNEWFSLNGAIEEWLELERNEQTRVLTGSANLPRKAR